MLTMLWSHSSNNISIGISARYCCHPYTYPSPQFSIDIFSVSTAPINNQIDRFGDLQLYIVHLIVLKLMLFQLFCKHNFMSLNTEIGVIIQGYLITYAFVYLSSYAKQVSTTIPAFSAGSMSWHPEAAELGRTQPTSL